MPDCFLRDKDSVRKQASNAFAVRTRLRSRRRSDASRIVMRPYDPMIDKVRMQGLTQPINQLPWLTRLVQLVA